MCCEERRGIVILKKWSNKLLVISIALFPFSVNSNPIPKASGVFSIHRAIMARCSKDMSTNISLANSAINSNLKIAHRDVMRIVNRCVTKYKNPQMEGFSIVASEALAFNECTASSCTADQRERLARIIFDANQKFTSVYAKSLIKNIRASCLGKDTHTCVNDGVDRANKTVEIINHSWIDLSEDNRIYSVGNDKSNGPKITTISKNSASNVIADVKNVVEVINNVENNDNLSDEAITALSINGFNLNNEAKSFLINELKNPAFIKLSPRFIVINLNMSEGECLTVLRNMDDFEATEITSGLDVVRKEKGIGPYCSKGDSETISIAYKKNSSS